MRLAEKGLVQRELSGLPGDLVPKAWAAWTERSCRAYVTPAV
jgi:hypothetical protein